MNPAVEYLLRTLTQPTEQSQVAQPVEPGIGLFEQFRQMNKVAANASNQPIQTRGGFGILGQQDSVPIGQIAPPSPPPPPPPPPDPRLTLGQRIGSAFARFGQAQPLSAAEFAALPPEQRRAQQIQGLTNLSDQLGLIAATQSGNPQRIQLAQQNLAQKAQAQQQISSLQNAGFSNEEINLYLAGVPASDILEIREQQGESNDAQGIIDSVNKNVAELTSDEDLKDFANFDQAFGLGQGIQNVGAGLTRPFGAEVFPETGAAIRAREFLNSRILALLADDFEGRPNLLIYETIQANLPTSSFTSLRDAAERYGNIKALVDQQVKALESGILSGRLTETQAENYRRDLEKNKIMSKQLEAVTLSLQSKEQADLEADVAVGKAGEFRSLYGDTSNIK